MFKFAYEPTTTRESVTTLGGEGVRFVERPIPKGWWEITCWILVGVALMSAFALMVVTQAIFDRGGNCLLPLGGAFGLMASVAVGSVEWWRLKVKYQARREHKRRT